MIENTGQCFRFDRILLQGRQRMEEQAEDEGRNKNIPSENREQRPLYKMIACTIILQKGTPAI